MAFPFLETDKSKGKNDMCEYCKIVGEEMVEIFEEDVDFGVLGAAGLTLDMTENNLFVNLTGKGCLDVQIEIKKPIKYCPFCGRKLK